MRLQEKAPWESVPSKSSSWTIHDENPDSPNSVYHLKLRNPSNELDSMKLSQIIPLLAILSSGSMSSPIAPVSSEQRHHTLSALTMQT